MKHECGILGLYNCLDPAVKTVHGLFSLQHRGQQGAGVYVSNGHELIGEKGFGLVQQAIDRTAINSLESIQPKHAIGQVLYCSEEELTPENLQPMYFEHPRMKFALCFDGGIVNQHDVNMELQAQGALFQSTSSCETLAHLLIREEGDCLDVLAKVLPKLDGAYTYLILLKDRLLAMRDPLGLMPLSLGKVDDGYIVASETCALDLLGATFIRDVEPGEIIEISQEGIRSKHFAKAPNTAHCAMEYVYFARPDSQLNGLGVHQIRQRCGEILAQESWVPSDIVVGVPESSLAAARGYAMESGLPLEPGLLKNKYSGRSFIESTQDARNLAVYLKLSAISYLLKDQRVTLIDDSIVRGTTSQRIVAMLREAGAKEIHLRIASPKITSPCFYGVDTSSYEELIGYRMSAEEIAAKIGADSLAFLSEKGMQMALDDMGLCKGCFSGEYPTSLYEYESLRSEAVAKKGQRR